MDRKRLESRPYRRLIARYHGLAEVALQLFNHLQRPKVGARYKDGVRVSAVYAPGHSVRGVRFLQAHVGNRPRGEGENRRLLYKPQTRHGCDFKPLGFKEFFLPGVQLLAVGAAEGEGANRQGPQRFENGGRCRQSRNTGCGLQLLNNLFIVPFSPGKTAGRAPEDDQVDTGGR
jgi:hypothetical protein